MTKKNTGKDNAQTLFTSFSARELEVLKCLARGMSDHEIAQELYISLNTVKWYNHKIFIKLGVCSRTQAIARGHNLHLFDEHPQD